MDTRRRDKLVEKLQSRDPWPLVTLEEFFFGNDDEGSIGCNLVQHPGIDFFYCTLKAIRERPDVQDVRIEIRDLNARDCGLWPFTDTVYIVANAGEKEVEQWLKSLQPDEVSEGDVDNRIANTLKLKPGMDVFAAWWD